MQPLEWLMAFKKLFLSLTHRSKLIHQGFSKKRHEPDPQIKAFPAKMFQMSKASKAKMSKAGKTIGMIDGF